MEWNTSFGCHNCSMNCCCKCKNEDCHFCKTELPVYNKFGDNYYKKFYTMHYNKCSEVWYKRHYVCFDCRIIKKTNIVRNKATYKSCNNNNTCAMCRKEMMNVSPNLRFPKKSDIRGWNLIEQILLISNPKINDSLFSHINKFGIFETNHMDPEIRKSFTYPKNMNEFKEFEEKLKTVIVNP